jgi:hypothetical protein
LATGGPWYSLFGFVLTEKQITKQAQQDKLARGERTAENIQYGEAISEHGFGGATTNIAGFAEQEGYGSAGASEETSDPAKTWREQDMEKDLESVHDLDGTKIIESMIRATARISRQPQ